jgi:hypothetical protein
MKLINIIWITIIFGLIILTNSCIICNNISWYGNINSSMISDTLPINPYVTIERNEKRIYFLAIIYYKNLDDYKVRFTLDCSKNIQQIDSIVAIIKTKENEHVANLNIHDNIVKSSIESNKFRFETDYPLILPKKIESQDMIISIYIYTNNKGIPIQNVSKDYKLDRTICKGLHWFPF